MVGKIPFQIDIPKRKNSCSQQGEELIPGMEYYSVLKEEGEGVFSRSDYCPSCWQKQEEREKQSAYTYWKSKVLRSKERDQLPSDRNERALVLLKEALDGEEEEQKKEAFVLCLYLAYQRYIALRQQVEEEGCVYSFYEVLATEEMLRVPKINVNQLQVETIQKSLASKLKV